MGWGAGEVSGMLPYSRMRGPPGPNYAEEPSELLMIGVIGLLVVVIVVYGVAKPLLGL